MFATAAFLFAIAAVGGLTMAAIHTCNRLPPTALVIAHGLFAAGGLVTLLLALGNGPGFAGTGGLAFLSFLMATIAGFYLFTRHLLRDSLPSSAVLIHGGLALAGIICLAVTVAGTAVSPL